jgi:uncharacterized protein (DUF983 family)
MQTVSCPSCGAPVEFRSHASVMAVCEFCRAAVLKDEDQVKDIGKISSVLEDFSPIQMGAAGVFGDRNFTVVGRIQVRYEQGMWNEWYLLFDDGTASWLGDSSGLYVITTPREVAGALPNFIDITPGQLYQIGGESFTAAEKREAECIGGQGELPFKVGDGWRIRVADFRRGASFITLDYTDGETPVVYNGLAVTLPALKFQLLRDDDQIKASAGKYRGKLDALDCPKCGSTINYLPGVTTNLVCPACTSQLDAAGPEATVLAAGESVERVLTTLQLGAKANILGLQYTVIGAMVRVDEEGTSWTEYLLYNTKESFFWLVETDEGWSRASVLPAWPTWTSLGAVSASLEKVSYTKLYDYVATVSYAAGAFNWRVAAGDQVRVYEFESGQTKLAAELTQSEMTWSRSTPVAWDQVKAWFGDSLKGSAPTGGGANGSLMSTQMKFVWWILGLNAIPLLFNFGNSFWFIIMALFALFYPAKYFQGDGDKK